MMQKAANAGDSVSYSGRQSFLAYRAGKAIFAQVDVDARVRQGTQVRVNSQRGQQLLRRFTPALISSRVVDDELLALLGRNYHLSGSGGANVAGRSASVVTATREGSSSAAARWWIDDATGIVLWQETYDRSGSADLSFGFTAVSVSHAGEHPGTSAAEVGRPADQHLSHALVRGRTECLGMVLCAGARGSVAGADPQRPGQ